MEYFIGFPYLSILKDIQHSTVSKFAKEKFAFEKNTAITLFSAKYA